MHVGNLKVLNLSISLLSMLIVSLVKPESCKRIVFLTHTLPGRATQIYLRPKNIYKVLTNMYLSIFGDTFLFLLLLSSYTFFFFFFFFFFFLSARDNKTIRDRITSGKSPLTLSVSFCSFCMLSTLPLNNKLVALTVA